MNIKVNSDSDFKWITIFFSEKIKVYIIIINLNEKFLAKIESSL